MLKYTINLPINLRLKIDAEKVKSAAGNKLAKNVRERLQVGQGAEGKLPESKSRNGAGEPLKDTGQLLESVKYVKRLSRVLPTGKRSDGKRNMAIMAMQNAERPELAATDPMGVTDEESEKFGEDAQKEINRQLAKGEAGLSAEIQNLKGIFK